MHVYFMADDSSYSIFVADKPVAVSHDYTGFSKLADGAYCTLWRGLQGRSVGRGKGAAATLPWLRAI